MATILRVTRHSEMTSEQAEALQTAVTKLTGEAGTHTVVLHSETVKDAAEILALAESAGAAVVEAVLPPAILADLTNPRINSAGIPVIRAQMDRVVDESGQATFTFNHYEKVAKVEVVVEAL